MKIHVFDEIRANSSRWDIFCLIHTFIYLRNSRRYRRSTPECRQNQSKHGKSAWIDDTRNSRSDNTYNEAVYRTYYLCIFRTTLDAKRNAIELVAIRCSFEDDILFESIRAQYSRTDGKGTILAPGTLILPYLVVGQLKPCNQECMVSYKSGAWIFPIILTLIELLDNGVKISCIYSKQTNKKRPP